MNTFLGVPHCRLAVSRISGYQWLCDLGPGVNDFWQAIGFVFDDGLAVLRLDLYIARSLVDLADKTPIAVTYIQHFRTSSKNVFCAFTSNWKRKTALDEDCRISFPTI